MAECALRAFPPYGHYSLGAGRTLGQLGLVPVARLVDTATVELQHWRRSDFAGLFTLTRPAEQPGCAFDAGRMMGAVAGALAGIGAHQSIIFEGAAG